MTLFTDSLYVSMTHERALELYCSRLNHQPRPAECASELARSHLQLTAAPQLPFGAATIERTQAVILQFVNNTVAQIHKLHKTVMYID